MGTTQSSAAARKASLLDKDNQEAVPQQQQQHAPAPPSNANDDDTSPESIEEGNNGPLPEGSNGQDNSESPNADGGYGSNGRANGLNRKRPPPLNTKEVRFHESDAVFTPSYEAYTPTPTPDLEYKVPERRKRGVLAPPSTVHRPNTEDTLRRVSVVIHKHITTCEARLQVHGPGPDDAEDEEEPFHLSKMKMFREENFVSPQYLYKFLRVPMARPGVCYSMKQVKIAYTIPTVDEIFQFMKTLFKKAALSSECSIVSIIYIERIMEVAHVPLVAITWRPVVLCGLLLASKVWQDLSSWNVEFANIFPQFSLISINRLERLFVNCIKWDLYISSSLYAKYYFALRSLYEKKDFRRRYNMFINVNAPKAEEISQRSGIIKEDLKDILSKSL